MGIPARLLANEARRVPAPLRAAVAAALARLCDDLAADGFEAVVTHDLHWLAEIFARWKDAQGRPARLPSVCNPGHFPEASTAEATIAVLLRRDGAVCASAAQRLIWLDGSLRDEMRSGRFFYGDGGPPPGWLCEANVHQADEIGDGPVVYTCAYRAELDGFGLARAQRSHAAWRLARVAQVLALARWPWSWMVARSGEGLALRNAPEAGGFTSQGKGLFVYPPGQVDAQGRRQAEKWQYLQFLRRRDLLRLVTEDHGYRSGASLLSPLPLPLETRDAAGAAAEL